MKYKINCNQVQLVLYLSFVVWLYFEVFCHVIILCIGGDVSLTLNVLLLW